MNRFLYLLLAAATFTGSAPVSIDTTSDIDDDDVPGIIESSHRIRNGPPAPAKTAVIVLPLRDEDQAVVPLPGVIDSLIVDHADAHVAVIHSSPDPARHDQRDGDVAAADLLITALRDAWHRGDLKVLIDLALPLERVTSICNANRFLYSRTVVRDGRRMHEFLADLYSMQMANLGRRGLVA